MGFSRDELARLVAAVGARDEVAMLELNVSCPNVETGLVMGADPAETAAAVERVRPESEKPLIVKLTPNAADPAAVARAAEEAGADAVSLVNTLKGMALHPETGEPWLGGRTGGVSGPAIRAIALEQVASVSRERSRSPLSAWAASRPGRQAADFLAAGAVRRRDRHRELPRPGRRPPDRRRAGRACPTGGAPRPSLDDRLSPFGGHGAAVSPQIAGTFSSVAPFGPICSIKTPANHRKNAQGPRTALKLRSRSR